MVRTTEAPASDSVLTFWARCEAGKIAQLLKLQSPLCEKISIESGIYVFEDSEDLLEHWHLIGDDLRIRFQISEQPWTSCTISIHRDHLFCGVEKHPKLSNSSVVAANCLAFFKESKSALKFLSFFICTIFGVLLWAYAVFVLEVNALADGLIVALLTVAGVLLAFFSRFVVNFIFPTIYKAHMSQAKSVLLLGLILPLIVGVILLAIQKYAM